MAKKKQFPNPFTRMVMKAELGYNTPRPMEQFYGQQPSYMQQAWQPATTQGYEQDYSSTVMSAGNSYFSTPADKPQPIQPEQQGQPAAQPQQKKPKNPMHINLPGTGDMLVAGLQGLNALLPQHQTQKYKQRDMVSSAYAQGNGSQAIMEYGGNVYGHGMEAIKRSHPFNPSASIAKFRDGGKSNIKVSEDHTQYDRSGNQVYNWEASMPPSPSTHPFEQAAPNDLRFIPVNQPQHRKMKEIDMPHFPSNRKVTYERLKDDATGNYSYSPVFHGNWQRHDILNTLKQLPDDFDGVPTVKDPNNYQELWSMSEGSNNMRPAAGRVVDTDVNDYGQPVTNVNAYFSPEDQYQYMDQYLEYGGSVYNVPPSFIPLQGEYGIHIKPENRGKFNATKARTGKTTEELTHSSNPITRKRAVFAQNAAKWNHAQHGAYVEGQEYDLSPEQIRQLEAQGYKLEY